MKGACTLEAETLKKTSTLLFPEHMVHLTRCAYVVRHASPALFQTHSHTLEQRCK